MGGHGPTEVARRALELRIERDYEALARQSTGSTRAMYLELAQQSDLAWHEQTPEGMALQTWPGTLSAPLPAGLLEDGAHGAGSDTASVEMMYVDDEPSGVVYTARCEWDHSRWWFAGTRTRPRERFHEALGQGAAPAPAAAVTGMPPRGSPSPTGVFPIRPSLSSASLPRAGGRSLSRAADAVSHTGSSEDPYFDMYPALMSAEEEQAAVAKQRAEQSLRMAFQGLRRLALASGLEDREIAAAACDECGVAGPGAERGRGAAEAAAAALSHGVAPEDADQALSVARLQRALADALPGKQHRARSPHRGPLRRGEGAGGEVAE